MKQKRTGEQIVKSVLTKLIKSMSIIAVGVTLIIMLLLYLGPEVTLDIHFFTRVTVISVVLCISLLIIYELWCKTGQDRAREEKDYQDLLKEYDEKSAFMDYSTMQEYLDYEEKRRYDVEYDQYTRLINRDEELLKKIKDEIQSNKEKASKLEKTKQNKKKIRRLMHVSIEDRWKIKVLTRRIKSNTRRRTNIVINMPYTKSEEFDYLRYNISSTGFKEYSPNDTKRYLNRHRATRYTRSITIAIFGINMLSFGTTMQSNIWYALFMLAITACTLLMSVVSGFSTGYKSISIVSTGTYKTANEYINKARIYCDRHGKILYYQDIDREKDKLEMRETSEEKIEKDADIVEVEDHKATINIS